MSTGGEVANAAACKAVIHGFKSHSVLQIFLQLKTLRSFDRKMTTTLHTEADLSIIARRMAMCTCMGMATVGEEAER